MRRAPLLLAVLSTALLLLLPAAATAARKTVWLCLPGSTPDPCVANLTTTVFSATGQRVGVEHITPAKHPKIDCFYVYPTVSDQTTAQANLRIQAVERSIALYQAARFSQLCRVFAPVYRQHTNNAPLPYNRAIPLADVAAAWHDYLTRYNHGRGVVLIGHSQGAKILELLMANEIERQPAVRRKLVSAILLGGNVLVKPGTVVGGTFQHIPGCASPTEVGCVIAYSTFDGPVPPDSQFGLPGPRGLVVLCTNPAALGRDTGLLDTILPTKPFAPGTFAQAFQMLGFNPPRVPTPWEEITGDYSAQCSSTDGANVLQVTPVGNAPKLTPAPDPTFGLHFADVNIAMKNLLNDVRSEAAAFARRQAR